MTKKDQPTPMDALSASDPFSEGPTAAEHQSRLQLFEDLTVRKSTTQKNMTQQNMTLRDGTDSTNASDETHHPDLLERAAEYKPKRRSFRRPLAGVGAIAAATAVAFFGFGLGATPSAATEMSAAASQLAASDTGAVVVTADLDVDGADNVKGIDPEIDATMTYTYDGDNYQIVAVGDGLGKDGADETVQTRVVDGTAYIDAGEQGWFELAGAEDLLAEAGAVGPSIKNFDGSGLEQLILLTEDVQKETGEGGKTTYAGTIQTAKIQALEFDQLPPSLVPLKLAQTTADFDGGPELPENLKVEMVIVDDVTQTVTVTIDDVNIDGARLSGEIVSDYSGVGSTQTIVAPPASEVVELPTGADPTEE